MATQTISQAAATVSKFVQLAKQGRINSRSMLGRLVDQ
jgi:hypothetical protein